MDTLEKTYFPFVIANTVFFSIAVIPVIGLIYLTWFLFIPAIGFSICNFLIARDGRYGTKPWDLIVMILACVAVIPVLGWLAAATALAFCITIIIKYKKWQQHNFKKTKDISSENETQDN